MRKLASFYSLSLSLSLALSHQDKGSQIDCNLISQSTVPQLAEFSGYNCIKASERGKLGDTAGGTPVVGNF